jgi:hypothetical protein
MGLFWDLLQQSQIHDTQSSTADLQQRVARLEAELERAWRIIRELVALLEEKFGQDIDRDGRIGR